VVDRETAEDRQEMQGAVCFDNVTFGYGDTPVLKNISLSVDAGKTLGIMGPTGSGKTSLINLITRLYDVQSGAVLVDGVDVRDWKLQQLRSHIGIATQDVFLFSDSIENNIAFSDMRMTEGEAQEFARLAAVDEFASYMPEGYETIIGERGVGLSGGQRQRIALARALAAKPSVLILDDTTSALDMETEKYIQDRLRELPFTCTKIIIAQRISSVKDADEILVLENGEITERGTHQELLDKKGYYYETYVLQNDIGGGDLR
jgi:ATP-binding cassette subfamily B protein